MKLPVLDTYSFPVTLPSSNETLTIRPFLVKEEKLLLLAQQSNNYTEQVSAITQVIKNCTNGQVDAKKVPYFDIEYLLVQLRTRSVGETVTPLYVCHNIPEGQDEECGYKTPLKINLQDVVVKNLPESASPTVALTDRYTLTLRYPTVYTVQKMMSSAAQLPTKNKSVTDIVDSMIDVFESLHDTQTGIVYKFDEVPPTEKLEFLNSLTSQQYEQITKFVGEMPSVSLDVEYTCDQCHFTHKIALKGLADFLG